MLAAAAFASYSLIAGRASTNGHLTLIDAPVVHGGCPEQFREQTPPPLVRQR